MLNDIKIRKRIILALFIREAKSRFGSKKLGILWALFEPIVQVMFFGALYYFTERPGPHGAEIYTFMVCGVVPFHLFQKTMIKTKDALKANKTLLAYPILKPIDTLIARGILEFIIYAVTFIILIYGCYHMDLIKTINSIDDVIISLVLASLLGLTFGISFAAIISFWATFDKIVPIISRILFFTSGIFFSLSMLPRSVRDIFAYNPVLNITEMARHGILPAFPDTYYSTTFVMIVISVSTAIAFSTLFLAERSPKAVIRGAS